MVMLVVLIESLFFLPADFLTLGCASVLQVRHDMAPKAVLMTTLAVWTGAWIGTNLNVRFLKHLLREKSQILLARSKFAKCFDQALEKHGFKIVLLLRLSPFFGVTVLV